jgi:hypothetical protein
MLSLVITLDNWFNIYITDLRKQHRCHIDVITFTHVESTKMWYTIYERVNMFSKVYRRTQKFTVIVIILTLCVSPNSKNITIKLLRFATVVHLRLKVKRMKLILKYFLLLINLLLLIYLLYILVIDPIML